MLKQAVSPRVVPETIRQARLTLATQGKDDPQRLYELAMTLLASNHIYYARRVLQKARESLGEAAGTIEINILRKLALCTYKDPDLPVQERLVSAAQLSERLLKQFKLSPEIEQDVKGVYGAIYKRRWEVYGQRMDLEKSLELYLSGYAMGISRDLGYTALNAAFTLDLLADQDRDTAGTPTPASEARSTRATEIRQEIVATLTRILSDKPNCKTDWWFLCTLGEAYLGLGQYESARETMRQAAPLQSGIKNWQLESTAKQIATLVRLRLRRENIVVEELDAKRLIFESMTPEDKRKYQAWFVLSDLLGGDTPAAIAAQSFFRGKVGLALSGGGFRASLFHIGVLAKLAELDVLRHVEVISCVSGGSILGAYYYLELRHLLRTRLDREITRQDYMDLVGRMEKNFLAGVQRNLRLRMLMGFGSNLKVLASSRSSTTHRLADLYERELYSRIEDGEQTKERYLDDLKILPLDGKQEESVTFNPKFDNWRRSNKVPILVLNATTLNTCHNWQFTASYMGEPPQRSIDAEINGNDRFRRMYHDEAPPRYQQARVRLGHAVAASACVPGLFAPLVFDGLYSRKDPKTGKSIEEYVTRLVDGGNYDNQGVVTLRDQDCTVLLVSDACGQTGVEIDPVGSHLGVSGRANDILMARVREAQYQLLAALGESGLLRGLMYVHLKKRLAAGLVDWVDCPEPSQSQAARVLTEYGIRQDIQVLLANVRTDLDAFSHAEADALMLSGYKMTGYEFSQCIRGFPVAPQGSPQWRFLSIAKIVCSDASDGGDTLSDLKKTLKAASQVTFKPWRLSKVLQTLLGASSLAFLTWLYLFSWQSWTVPLQSVLVGNTFVSAMAKVGKLSAGKMLVAGAMIFLALPWFKKFFLTRFLGYRNSYVQIIASVLLCTFGWLLLWMHLQLIEPRYLKSGPKYREDE